MPKQKIKVLFTTAELTPLAKVGGLGDVAGALPKALKKLNTDIRIVLPNYDAVKQSKIKTTFVSRLIVPFGAKKYRVNVLQTKIPDSSVVLYLLEHRIFNNPKQVYSGGAQRFMFFAQCINEFLKTNVFKPDVLHVNDWHPANIISLIKKDPTNKKKNIKILLTIHNLGMQGKIKTTTTKLWHPSLYDKKQKTHNSLKQAIINADLINTVSHQYSREILTKEYGAGLNKLLNKRKKDLYGIVNGLDLDLFNPQKDKYLKQNFSITTLGRKAVNKKFLQTKSGLKVDPKIPIFGLVSRLAKQKGIDLIIDIIEELAKLNAQYIFTGTGLPKIEKAIHATVKKYPTKFFFVNKFDVPFGQQIYGGSDMFLMPSSYEPCGLGQMIAMEYACVPIVRATGGLKDTVTEGKTGFVFKNKDSQQLLQAIQRAYQAYQDQTQWTKIVKAGMQADHSWDKSAKEYLSLYKKLLKK